MTELVKKGKLLLLFFNNSKKIKIPCEDPFVSSCSVLRARIGWKISSLLSNMRTFLFINIIHRFVFTI